MEVIKCHTKVAMETVREVRNLKIKSEYQPESENSMMPALDRHLK